MALEKYQSERDAADFGRECRTLARAVIEAAEDDGGLRRCGATLGEEVRAAPPALIEHTLVAPAEALRIEGNIGYVLYHGMRSKEYVAKMERENGEWKVASVFNEEIR